MQRRTLAITGILLLILVAVVVAQRARRVTPPTHTVTFEASATPSPKRVYYCEGITKKGERCKRRVREPGLMCWQHREQKLKK